MMNKNKKNFYKKNSCRVCGNRKLKKFINLGIQPLANNLNNNKKEKNQKYPLEVNFCKVCCNCQLSVCIDSKKMFSNYLYTSSTSITFKKHFERAANKYIKLLNLNPIKSKIIDVGSNDGIALIPFKKKNYKNILGIEPAKNLSKIAMKKKINTFNGFLNKANLKYIEKDADLILASNVFAHSDNLKEMAECMLALLKKNGVIIIEVQYLIRTLKDLTYDNIYHEHFNYWSLTSLVNFFNKLDANIFKAEKIQTHGGSIRIYINKNKSNKINKNVKKILNEEIKYGIRNLDTYLKFAKKVYKLKSNVISNLKKLKKKKKILIGYGAPAKATTALNFYGIKNELKFIVDENKLKHGKFIPGVNLEIFSKSKIKKKYIVIVLAWNFFKEIKEINKNLSNYFINIKDFEKNKINI